MAVQPGARENRGQGRTWQGAPPTKTASAWPGVACRAGCVQLRAGWALCMVKSRVPFPLPGLGWWPFAEGCRSWEAGLGARA